MTFKEYIELNLHSGEFILIDDPNVKGTYEAIPLSKQGKAKVEAWLRNRFSNRIN